MNVSKAEIIPSAIILAGGFGTRLQSLVSDVPKPMASVGGRPFLAYLLDYLINQGIARVILALGYKHQAIIDYFGKRYRSLDLTYLIEESPLGTGGALQKALAVTDEGPILALNGDTFLSHGIRPDVRSPPCRKDKNYHRFAIRTECRALWRGCGRSRANHQLSGERQCRARVDQCRRLHPRSRHLRPLSPARSFFLGARFSPKVLQPLTPISLFHQGWFYRYRHSGRLSACPGWFRSIF